MRKSVKVEDAIIGSFVLLALLYPIIVTLLIYEQKGKGSSREIDILRTAYLFLAGLEDCSPETASHLAQYMDVKLLRKLGGVGGLTRSCMENRRKVSGNVVVEEDIERTGKVILMEVEIKVKEKGMFKGSLRINLYGFKEGNTFKITEIEYVKGG